MKFLPITIKVNSDRMLCMLTINLIPSEVDQYWYNNELFSPQPTFLDTLVLVSNAYLLYWTYTLFVTQLSHLYSIHTTPPSHCQWSRASPAAQFLMKSHDICSLAPYTLLETFWTLILCVCHMYCKIIGSGHHSKPLTRNCGALHSFLNECHCDHLPELQVLG